MCKMYIIAHVGTKHSGCPSVRLWPACVNQAAAHVWSVCDSYASCR